jgi:SAM-dependent methyltransferase
VEHRHALELIRSGIPAGGGVWADLGAGSGTFSRALADLLGEGGTVVAVDRATVPPARPPDAGAAEIIALHADFTRSLDLAPLGIGPLDGILMANALHFVRRQRGALGQLVSLLRPGGTVVLVEYDLRRGTPWIPFPIPPDVFDQLAADVGLTHPIEIGRRRSRFGPRDLYAVQARLR